MERLSAKLDGKGVIMLPSGVEHDWCIGTRKVGDVTIQYLSGAAADRLDAYEDTGLTPEAVIDLQERFRALYNEFNDLDLVDPVHFYAFLERVCRWQQAERDGRLVVLPCKVGDTVYFPVESRWDSATIEHIEVWSSGVRFFWVQYDVGPETNELWDDGYFEMEDIGKTVFLTRQKAEAAEHMEGEST